MRNNLILDLDGTLLDITHRLMWIEMRPKNYEQFLAAIPGDTPIYSTVRIAKTLIADGVTPWFVTGRPDSVREATLDQIRKLFPEIGEDIRLFMRKTGDKRPDAVVKLEWLQSEAAPPLETILGVFEDRKSVVDMWRDQGLLCYSVAEGNF